MITNACNLWSRQQDQGNENESLRKVKDRDHLFKIIIIPVLLELLYLDHLSIVQTKDDHVLQPYMALVDGFILT